MNKDETANINDGSLTWFFKGKYNWESADGSELTNLCPLCQEMKKSSPSVWRWKMTESVRGWKNARSGTSGFHVRPNPQMTPQTRPCLCVASIIVFLCFDNSISLGVPFVFAAFVIALLSVLSQYISLCPRPKEESNGRPDNGSMATTWQFKLFSCWLICRETDDLAHLH